MVHTHFSQFRVYAEDTDLMGIVYHANHLRFFERARTEMLRDNGFLLSELAQMDCHFAIHSVELKYAQPIHLDDLIIIETSVINKSSCSLLFEQIMRKGHNSELCHALVKVVCVNERTKPRRLPVLFDVLDSEGIKIQNKTS